MTTSGRSRSSRRRQQLPVREQPFQQQVTDLADMLGWEWNHVYRCPRSDRTPNFTPTTQRGWPDLYLWHGVQHRAMHVELKGDGGTTSADQDRVLASLAAAGLEVYVWWPRDLQTTIPTILRRRPRP